jgi:hypothetical protein
MDKKLSINRKRGNWIAGNAVWIHSNLASSFEDFDYTFTSSAQLPTDSAGLIFPFVSELCLPDYSTPLSFLSDHFLYGLGYDQEDSHKNFEFLRGGWGVIARTHWGNELAHMFYCLRLAFKAQSTIRVVTNADNVYQGSLILGWNFAISINGQEPIEAKERDTMIKDYDNASPHDNTLINIFRRILYATDAQRDTDITHVNTLHDLRFCISQKGMTEEGRVYTRKHAHLLAFADTKSYLSITAENIARVLTAIHDESTSEREFPIYPSMVVETSRRKRLWSAFGPTAPSFRVTGGKVMQLEGAFEVREREKGKDVATRPVKKIGCIVKPLDKSLQDLEDCISMKNVVNPHGSAVIARVSSQSLIRSLEGDSCQKILAAFRTVSGVTVMDEAGASNGKRKNDTRGDAEVANKRGRFMDF